MQQIIPGIFETDVGGHKAIYVKVLIEALNDIGVRPVLFMPEEVKESEPFRFYLAPLQERFQYVAIPTLTSRNTYWQEQERIKLLIQTLDKRLVQHLFIPYGDGLVQRMGVAGKKSLLKSAGPCRIESLVFRCRFAYPQRSFLARVRARLLLWGMVRAPISTLHVLDAMGFARLRSEYPQMRFGLNHMPELLEPWGSFGDHCGVVNEKSRIPLDCVPNKSKIIGVLGATTHRKGCDLLLRAFAETSKSHDAVLLIAGPHCNFLKEQLNRHHAELCENGRILSVDRFLSEEEFRELFQRVDMVCLPYRDHQGVSSIYLRAAVLGKPTLASNRGWFSWAVPHYEHGEMVDVNSPNAFRESLLSFINKSHREHRISPQGEQILRDNSPAAVKNAWTASLRCRLHGLA